MVTINQMREFLEEYDYEVTDEGLSNIWDEWYKNKKDLIERMRKHPNWNEENMAIVFKNEQYERGFDENALKEFKRFVKYEIQKIIEKEGIDIAEIENKITYLESIIEAENTIRYRTKLYERTESKNDLENIVINENVTEYRDILRRRIKEKRDAEWERVRRGNFTIDQTLALKIVEVENGMDYITGNCREKQITEEQAQKIKEITKLDVASGTKLTKVIQKICKILDIDKVKRIEKDRNGNDKDYGFNYQYAKLADAINPMKYKRITVISVNPMDYWGMSFGNTWASCHTIDKENKRGVSGNHYNGCYSSGTESYMLDESSVIFYTVREDYEGNEYWKQDKYQRVVFCVNKEGNLLVESRVYPDGRDGGDSSLAKQFREVMQKVISDIFEEPNYWDCKKDIDEIRGNTITTGTHYRDYLQYNDCTISEKKDSLREYPRIRIGHYPICPCCGEEHELEESIICEDCDGNYCTCEYCGNRVREDDAIFVGDCAYSYCCEECAENDGYVYCADTYEYERTEDVHYCTDDDRYHDDDHCFYDEYIEEWRSGSPEVITEEGTCFESVDNAIGSGYVQDHNGYWWLADELSYDEVNEVWFHLDYEGLETEDHKYFVNEETAKNEGYKKNDNGSWVKEEEVA